MDDQDQKRQSWIDRLNQGYAAAIRTRSAARSAKSFFTVIRGAKTADAIAEGAAAGASIWFIIIPILVIFVLAIIITSPGNLNAATGGITAQDSQTAPVSTPEQIKSGFNIQFDSAFDGTVLSWANAALKNARSVAPNFFTLLSNASGGQPIMVKITKSIGHREGNTIFFREGRDPLKYQGFFAITLIHELAHIIYSPDKTGKNLQRDIESAEGHGEGFLTSYAANATSDPNVICDSNSNDITTKQSEDFAETVTYFINKNEGEFSYDSAVCPAKLPDQNPIYSGFFPQHLFFAKSLLTSSQ